VARNNILLKTVALVAIFGPVVLLWIGVSYGVLSDREWAIGGLVWAATLPASIIIVRKWLAKHNIASSSELPVSLDDRARKRILRGMWISKAWIGILAVLLPVGIAIGMAHRAWLPTLAGVAMSLLLMYLSLREIRRRREQINLSRQ
jgi:hypothetical protein